MKFNLKTKPWQFNKGVIMEQHKDPALSREIGTLIVPERIRRIRDMEPWSTLEEVEPQDIIRTARAARIVDERDGLPLFKKLKLCLDKKVVIRVDALDDEPYISSQLGPLLHRGGECLGGLRLAQKAIGSTAAEILIYRNISDLDLKIPKSIEGVPVHRVAGAYPAEIRSGASFVQEDGVDYLYLGACSLIHLNRAVFEGLMHTTTFVTVAGNCIGTPCNLEVSTGVTATEVLQKCRLVDEPTRVVIGGSITGISVPDTDRVRMGVTTRALLAFREDERDRRYQCIGCGRCVEACPMELNPAFLYKAIAMSLHPKAEELDYKMCVGCMCCSYVCPAKLDIAGRIAWYKQSRGGEPK